MDKTNPKHNNSQAPAARSAFQKPAVWWGFAILAAVLLGVVWSYYWRVFYYLDGRVSPLLVTGGCVAFALLVVGVAALLRYAVKAFAARGTLCILLCGLLFVFANPPLQAPDENAHYLRTYAISIGHFDFDAARQYPDDVAYLMEAFPGAWVNAHTSVGIGTDPDTGADKPYDTAGYALKQYGDTGAIESVADSFALYFARDMRDSLPKPVTEPINFLIISFLPGAFGMAVARLLGFAALGCLYGGRIGNLLGYTVLCYLALRKAEHGKAVLLCVMLLPVSLFMGASLSYDATLLACYYLMLALMTCKSWDTRTAALYAAVCVYANIAKPYLNLLWALLPLLVAAKHWRAKGRRWQWTVGALAGALCMTMLVEWYGGAFRYNYPVIARQGGETVNGGAQLAFLLSNPLRSVAVFWGTLCENDFFIGQTGLFGWKDMPIPALSLTGPLVLLCGATLAAASNAPGQSMLGCRKTVGLGVFAAVYALGAMAAMYITYTPVGMVRIVGLQTRYFLPVFVVLLYCAATLLRRVIRPLNPQRTEYIAVFVSGGYAVLGAVLLFAHYFVGPFYTIPIG